jgi:16S rRNA (cytosine967-C5)-methyltransferase
MQQLAILDSQWVIQDMASASTVEMVDSSKKVSHWWDACCGAGGKSLLWYKHFPGVQITATDIRSSILNNYQERMKRYRFAHNTYVWDAYQQVNPKRYEGVIADVPCTGSGTWARTPEAHYFFKAEQLDFYPKLQKQILKNLSKSLDPGAQLIYITCSVFEQENEAILKYAEESLGLCVEEMKYFQCSEIKGDTLFAARLVLR